MVKWPFRNHRSQQHDGASSVQARGVNTYHHREYSYDVVQTSNPGWPGPPYPGGHSTAATLQTSPIAYSLSSPSHYHAHNGFARSPYPASSTANALFPTAPSFPLPGAHANSDRWRDMSAPATNDAPYLEYTGSDKPTPEDLRRALFIPCFSPPPPHWRALIPSDPEPDANGFYAPPINRFPVELLSYIFARCMDKEVEKPFYGYFRPNCTPLVIARVCRLWRYIALDLPLLWQHFSMRPCQGGGHYRIARLFMERTKGLGIYVYYAEDSRRGVYPREVCPCALDFIIRNIGLVKRLYLVEISPSSLLRLSRVRPGMATFMMKLAITTREANTKRNVAQALSSLYNTPTIREVEWSIPTFPENAHWSRIVSILLRECVVDTYTLIRIIIASSPALQRIDVDITPDVSAVRYRPVYHGIMEELIIESDGPQDMLFQALDFPNLRRLYLRPRSSIPDDAPYSHGWPFLDIDNLYRFLGRLRAGLQYFLLVCGGASFDEPALLHIIRMPQLSPLKMLHIAELGRGASDAVFEELTLIEGSRRAVTLPHLQRLALCDCSTTDGTISRMLQSRDKGSCPLRRLSLGYPIGEQRVHDADVATMEMLRRKGWMIFWSSCFGD